MQLEAARLRPSSMPALTRGSGLRYRLTQASVAQPAAACGAAWSLCKPTAASPSVPVTYTSSPGRAPARVSTLRGLADPMRRDVECERPGRLRDVAADQRDAVRRGERQQTVEQLLERGDVQGRRQREREQRGVRRCAHRRQIAQVDGQRAMSDRIGGHEAAIEVDAVHLRVGGQDVERASLRLDDRRVVAWTDDDPRGHRHARLDAGDERTFTDVSDRECVHSGSARTDAERREQRKSPALPCGEVE